MRILHLSDRLSERGGAFQHLLALVEAQVAEGHDVTLAVGRVDPGATAPCAVRETAGLDARGEAKVELDALADAVTPDVVHLHTIVNPEALRWAGGRDAVITVQDHRYFCPGRGKWTLAGEPCQEAMAPGVCAGCFDDAGYFDGIWTLTRERLAALHALRVVVLSRYMSGELVAAGLDPDRIAVVPPVLRAIEPPPGSSEVPCVLFVGRLVAGKGALEAVEAWRRSGVALPFVAAGAGPLRPELERRGAMVLGWVERARLAGLYARAQVVVMPSRWQEPFGIVGLEALAHGVPVAAWDSGGVREWHPGEGLVPWGDVPGLASAIRALVGTRARVPDGFERGALMARLSAVYRGRPDE